MSEGRKVTAAIWRASVMQNDYKCPQCRRRLANRKGIPNDSIRWMDLPKGKGYDADRQGHCSNCLLPVVKVIEEYDETSGDQHSENFVEQVAIDGRVKAEKERDTAQAEIRQLRRDAAEIQAKLDKANETIIAYRGRLKDEERIIDGLRADIRAREKEIARAERKIYDLEQELRRCLKPSLVL